MVEVDAVPCEMAHQSPYPWSSVTLRQAFHHRPDDYIDRALDFNELLVAHPAATFALRVAGDSMIDLGIFPGDIAVVDRALTPTDGKVILGIVSGEFTLKRYRVGGSQIWLEAANSVYGPMPIARPNENSSRFLKRR